jgi:protein-L-isoaspartate(D-aspartate) O-methyltransferase
LDAGRKQEKFLDAGMHDMIDMTAARRTMVDSQVRTADVTDLALIGAMLDVPRERFVPPAHVDVAYLDRDVPVAPGRALLKPMVLAKLIQAMGIRDGDHVLVVGCTSGYGAAVLGRLAGSVVALDQDPALTDWAASNLAAVGATNVVVKNGVLPAGWPQSEPYDAILLEGATEIAPEQLGRQLKPDGRLVCVLGRTRPGKAMVYRMVEGGVSGRPIFDAAAPVVPGFVAPLSFVF